MTKKNSTNVSTNRHELVSFLDSYLRTDAIKDDSCNGLQVQGTDTVKTIALVVDASMQAFKLALEHGLSDDHCSSRYHLAWS